MKKLLIVCLFAFSAIASAAGNYIAKDTDYHVSSMLRRWAAQDGWSLVWDLPYDFPIGDTSDLNNQLKLSSQSDLHGSIDYMLGSIKKLGPLADSLFPVYCETSKTIIIADRKKYQGKPLPCGAGQ